MRYQNRNNGFPVHPGSAYQGGYPQSMPMNHGGYQPQMPMNPYPYGMPQPPGYGYGGMQGGYGPQMPPQNNFGPYPYQPQANMGNGPQQYSGPNPYNQLFHNPLQPEDGYQYEKFQQHEQPGGYNPYPLPAQMQKPPGGNFGSILNSFKSQDGNIDINKMMNTTGQMMNALTQVSGMVKGLGGIFKV